MVFLEGLPFAFDDDVGAETVHGHRRHALGLQARVQVIQRRLIGDQQGKAVGKAKMVFAHKGIGQVRMRVNPARHPVGLGVACGGAIHLQQPARRFQEFGKPIPDRHAFLPG
ncbi:hypothetical protein D3C87_1896650 [compost metagenome]